MDWPTFCIVYFAGSRMILGAFCARAYRRRLLTQALQDAGQAPTPGNAIGVSLVVCLILELFILAFLWLGLQRIYQLIRAL